MKKKFVLKSFKFILPMTYASSATSSGPPPQPFIPTVSFGHMRLIDVADPIYPQDAVTLNFFEVAVNKATDSLLNTLSSEVSAISQRLDNITPHAIDALSLYGDVMLGNINMNGIATVTGLTNPTSPGDAVSFAFAEANYLPKQEGLKDLDMGGNRTITGLENPVEAGDAVNYQTLKDCISNISAASLNLLPISGGTLYGNLNMNCLYTITGLPNPTTPTDAVSLGYLNSYYLPITGGTLTGNINLQGLYTVSGIPQPTKDSDAVNLATLKSTIRMVTPLSIQALPLSGGTMTGNLDMGGIATITGLENPIQPDEAVNLGTLTSMISPFLSKNGGLLSGNLNFNSQYTVTGITDPIHPGDAVNFSTFKTTETACKELSSQIFPITGGTMSGHINMGKMGSANGYSIIGLSDPTSNSEVVPLSYVQSYYLPLTGGFITGSLSLSSNLSVLGNSIFAGPTEIRSSLYFSSVNNNDFVDFGALVTPTGITGGITVTGLKNPINPSDPVNLSYLDTNYLSLNGGSINGDLHINGDLFVQGNTLFTGDVILQGHATFTANNGPLAINFGNTDTNHGAILTGIGSPTNLSDAINLAFLNKSLSSYIPLSGGTLEGNLDMNNHRITNLADPVESHDAVNLHYLQTQGILQAYFIKLPSQADSSTWLPMQFLSWKNSQDTFLQSQHASSYFTINSADTTQILLPKKALYSITSNILLEDVPTTIGRISLYGNNTFSQIPIASISPGSISHNYSLSSHWIATSDTSSSSDYISLHLDGSTSVNISSHYWAFMATNIPM
ncbi:hypothetical protein CLAVI_000923 [Candidatus Clavichlamydia salmonicola]|uniref:hypothetical protein n=1 Tax=Candidatus Clavichlamydia salmonicola TaxID=469812 RepID=UPI001891B081|nr:hypothetical protein [Candidatus Clavichlamydia salmonicola]MBF5051282.1 hypothetical protein [Candidatus Clavichlamydia salmonicola]